MPLSLPLKHQRQLARLTAIRIFGHLDDAGIRSSGGRARYAGQEFLTEEGASELATFLTQDDIDPLAACIFGASTTNVVNASSRTIRHTTTTRSRSRHPISNRCRATGPRSFTIRRTERFLR